MSTNPAVDVLRKMRLESLAKLASLRSDYEFHKADLAARQVEVTKAESNVVQFESALDALGATYEPSA